ncbi:mitochondrial carrier domain-containing protein [Chaetomium tenue]|uniref:Mitochondrial carrier domain-containing protein n=1 Tax=Chaetomium tenue TaxID=1854479 RepID=A0ACB7P7J8_9PEZI|nr:mitochondrial carrier domain-containing protein [Chaetomium globosum]
MTSRRMARICCMKYWRWAGAVAAFTTRYQSQGYLGLKNNLSSSKETPYTALRGLYQGIGSVVLATLPAAAVFFASYESTKPLLRHALPNAVPGPVIHAFASAGTEMASCLVLTPAEVIKQNAQVLQRSGSSSLGQSSSLQALHMLRRNGAGVTRTLWRGYTTLVARNLPYTAIQFPTFEYLRAWIWTQRRQGHHSEMASWTIPETTTDGGMSAAAHSSFRSLLVETGLVTGSAAAISGSFASAITTPADVVKTRVMLGNRNGSQGPSGVVEIVRAVLRESGIPGLSRGGSLRAAWAALGSGLYLGSYEVTKVWLKHRSP